MSDLTDKFAALEAQLAAQAATMGAYVDEVEDKLDGLYTQLDTLNNNGATNTRYLLDALSRIDPCATCPPPSILIPPINDDPFFPGEESCKRSQAFVAYMQSATTMLDLVSGLGTGTFPSLVLSAYQEVIDSSAMFTGVPLISFPEGVSLVGYLINYGILNIGRGDTLRALFDTLADAVRGATFNSVTAIDAKAKYAAVINASGLDSDEKTVLIGAAYDGLFTFFFDPASTPDLTGFSGTACGAIDTICATSTGNFIGDFSTHNASWTGTDVMAAIIPGSDDVIFDQGFGDYTFECVTCTPGNVLAVSFLTAGGGVTTSPLPALFFADPLRRVYVRDAVADCVIDVCIAPPAE